MKWYKGGSLGCYFILSILFMETVFHYYVYETFSIMNILTTFAFLCVISLFMHILVLLLKNKLAFSLSIVLLAIISMIYISQTIYFAFFKTFYSMYSVGKGMSILQFWNDIMKSIGANVFWIGLFIIPVLMLAIFGRNYFQFQRGNMSTFGFLLSIALLLQLTGIGLVHVGDKGQHSAYELYYEQHLPLQATDKLGLLTSMRLDIQRTLTNWSPMLATPPVLDELPNEDVDELGAETEEDPEEEPVLYNTLDIDFKELMESEEDEEIIDLHTYFSQLESTEKNEMTGKYEGYNLILLTGEAFSPFAVDPEITPTLYKLVHEGYYFPKNGVWSMEQSAENNLPFALGNQLGELGYTTKAYHNHTYTYYGRDQSHPNLGYDYQGIGNGLDVEETWPESDLEMMEKTMDEYIDDEPFHTYYMTVSGHMQYSFEGNYIAWKNEDLVKDTPYSAQARAYLATQIELDRALAYMIERLEEAGIADRTLIAMTGDHYPYGLDDETIDEFAGHPVDENFELFENHFILYEPGAEGETIDKYGSSFDVLPTLSNMFGLDYDSRFMVGTDLFSETDPLIPFLNKSFITNKGMYNSLTEEFIPHKGEAEVDDAYIEQMMAYVDAHFYYSTKVLELDYFRHLGLQK